MSRVTKKANVVVRTTPARKALYIEEAKARGIALSELVRIAIERELVRRPDGEWATEAGR